MQHPPTAVDYESLVTLSLQLKWQHINLDVNFHVVIVALDEVALLHLASPLLVPACDPRRVGRSIRRSGRCRLLQGALESLVKQTRTWIANPSQRPDPLD
ncbi:Aste57867_2824 [Aphanomyces stellatus]|uniref:Aste57867_2824 protein n=1 Tax=Aphanomyces stellatus TaxID=120398 RepID=A0A485K8D5_9STRA|nr:hypothetical protein As57867_002817 [Aphanomyces stellatus]VFT80012.1 Aste57867_2824 [Aphanomyces stellatus]